MRLFRETFIHDWVVATGGNLPARTQPRDRHPLSTSDQILMGGRTAENPDQNCWLLAAVCHDLRSASTIPSDGGWCHWRIGLSPSRVPLWMNRRWQIPIVCSRLDGLSVVTDAARITHHPRTSSGQTPPNVTADRSSV